MIKLYRVSFTAAEETAVWVKSGISDGFEVAPYIFYVYYPKSLLQQS